MSNSENDRAAYGRSEVLGGFRVLCRMFYIQEEEAAKGPRGRTDLLKILSQILCLTSERNLRSSRPKIVRAKRIRKVIFLSGSGI